MPLAGGGQANGAVASLADERARLAWCDRRGGSEARAFQSGARQSRPLASESKLFY